MYCGLGLDDHRAARNDDFDWEALEARLVTARHSLAPAYSNWLFRCSAWTCESPYSSLRNPRINEPGGPSARHP